MPTETGAGALRPRRQPDEALARRGFVRAPARGALPLDARRARGPSLYSPRGLGRRGCTFPVKKPGKRSTSGAALCTRPAGLARRFVPFEGSRGRLGPLGCRPPRLAARCATRSCQVSAPSQVAHLPSGHRRSEMASTKQRLRSRLRVADQDSMTAGAFAATAPCKQPRLGGTPRWASGILAGHSWPAMKQLLHCNWRGIVNPLRWRLPGLLTFIGRQRVGIFRVTPAPRVAASALPSNRASGACEHLPDRSANRF